jgi:exonuclease III
MNMKYSSIIALMVLYFLPCTAQKNQALKVMTWNIWHGGLHGKKTDDFKKDSSNTINILKVLEQESPDLLFMQETYCCGMEIAKKAGYPYSCRGSSNLSIHSKYPITDTISLYHPFNSHGVVIDFNNEKLLCLNIWLNYLPDYFNSFDTLSANEMILGERATRLIEITDILKSVDNLSKKLNMPVIMGGDFNSGSHLDWVESTRKWHFDKVVEWPVSKVMADNSYVDSFREANPDPTKTLEGTWGFHDNGYVMSDRIDFIYYNANNITTKDSKIVMDDPIGGFFNSDHRAILTTFHIKY